MKIICKDNFNRESVNDKLVCENVSSYYGDLIVNILNEKLSGDHSSDYFELVDNDYELYRWEP